MQNIRLYFKQNCVFTKEARRLYKRLKKKIPQLQEYYILTIHACKQLINIFFFLNDKFIFGYIVGVCSLSLVLFKQKPSFKLSYLIVYLLQNNNFLGKKEDDIQALAEMLKKMKANISDFAESITKGKEDVIFFKKNKKHPTTLYNYLSNILNKK